MSTLVRWYIKSALVALTLAMLAGALVLLNHSLGIDSRLAVLQLVFYHLLMVGWATQLIAGVALWMFPPFSREQPRGDERLGWLAFGALNGGLLLRVMGEPLHTWTGGPLTAGMLVVSALLQAFAIWAIVLLLWPRVRGKK